MNQELAGQILQLSRTGLEGLEHIQKQNEKGDFETGIKLFSDVVWAVSEIEKALAAEDEAIDDPVKTAQDELILVMGSTADAYENENYQHLPVIMKDSLLPLYRQWQQVLQEQLAAYLN